jgi:hypothetical protein
MFGTFPFSDMGVSESYTPLVNGEIVSIAASILQQLKQDMHTQRQLKQGMNIQTSLKQDIYINTQLSRTGSILLTSSFG